MKMNIPLHVVDFSFVSCVDLEDIKESLAWVSSSPILKNLTTQQKESLSTFVKGCRNEMQIRLNGIMKEEEEHQNVAEEVKEKNFMLEKDLYKSIITQAKQINVQLVYGKNKCDLSVCYNKFRSKSSAISSFDFCDIGAFIEELDSCSDFLFLISSVSFYCIIQLFPILHQFQ